MPHATMPGQGIPAIAGTRPIPSCSYLRQSIPGRERLRNMDRASNFVRKRYYSRNDIPQYIPPGITDPMVV